MLSANRLVVPVYLISILLSAALLGGYWSWQGQQVRLPEAASATHKLQCVSYSPFDKDQSPLDHFVIRPERMDADLALLSQYFSCVRTYSMTGFEGLPELAHKHGLKVMLGAWVSPDEKNTRLEIEQLIAAANRYPHIVQSVIVGNEALLRKDISAQRLAELITEVKQRVAQPVTYADVWEFWIKHPQIAPVVDFVTIHLLPYWEDEPTSGARALEHIAEVHAEFERRLAPKDIFIGEVGWPSEGRQRETAIASRIEQARFTRGFVAMAEHNGWQYNIIEAFDQPWKRNNEGAVGGYWGLFDADRHDKQILAGPVSNVPDWQHWLIVSGGILLLTLIVAGVPATREAALLIPVFGAIGGACIALWWHQAAFANRDSWEWLWTIALTILNAAILLRAALAFAPVASKRGRVFLRLEVNAGRLLIVTAFVAAVLMLQLVFDPRYRLFPSYVLLLPALVFLRLPTQAPKRELALLLLVIAVGIPFQLWEETWRNAQALGWAATSALLVLALTRSWAFSSGRAAASTAAISTG